MRFSDRLFLRVVAVAAIAGAGLLGTAEAKHRDRGDFRYEPPPAIDLDVVRDLAHAFADSTEDVYILAKQHYSRHRHDDWALDRLHDLQSEANRFHRIAHKSDRARHVAYVEGSYRRLAATFDEASEAMRHLGDCDRDVRRAVRRAHNLYQKLEAYLGNNGCSRGGYQARSLAPAPARTAYHGRRY